MDRVILHSWLGERMTDITANEIVQTDAEVDERETWADFLASLEPEDYEFEAELEQWEMGRD